MNFIGDLADRLGVSRWVIWVGLAALVVAIVIIVRRIRSGGTTGVSSTATNAGTSGQNDVLNGPFGSGIDGTSANPVPPSPDGGADQGTTPAPTQPAPTTSSGSTPTTSAAGSTGAGAVYVHPTSWPSKTSTISGLAQSYGTTTAKIESFPENQYIRTRSPRGFDLIYTSDTIRVK